MNNKRDHCIEAAIDLFAQEGFWNAPTSRIAKHAKVSPGTLFNYFSSKDALIDAVYLQLKHEIVAYLVQGYPETEDVRVRLAHLYRRYVEWGVYAPVRFSLLEQLRLSNLASLTALTQIEEEHKFLFQVVEECSQQGLFVDIPVDYASFIIATQMNSTTKYAIAQGLRDEPLTQHIEQSFDICWKGLSKRCLSK